jgi:hypothetical protein
MRPKAPVTDVTQAPCQASAMGSSAIALMGLGDHLQVVDARRQMTRRIAHFELK